jgi:hypothetical protein
VQKCSKIGEGARVPATIKGIRTPRQMISNRPREAPEAKSIGPRLKSNEMNYECLLRHGGVKRRVVLGSPILGLVKCSPGGSQEITDLTILAIGKPTFSYRAPRVRLW